MRCFHWTGKAIYPEFWLRICTPKAKTHHLVWFHLLSTFPYQNQTVRFSFRGTNSGLKFEINSSTLHGKSIFYCLPVGWCDIILEVPTNEFLFIYFLFFPKVGVGFKFLRRFYLQTCWDFICIKHARLFGWFFCMPWSLNTV